MIYDSESSSSTTDTHQSLNQALANCRDAWRLAQRTDPSSTHELSTLQRNSSLTNAHYDAQQRTIKRAMSARVDMRDLTEQYARAQRELDERRVTINESFL